jgi:hypothetical protein
LNPFFVLNVEETLPYLRGVVARALATPVGGLLEIADGRSEPLINADGKWLV